MFLTRPHRLTLAAAIGLSGCGDLCSSELLTAAPSPGTRHEARLLRRDCGATTGYSYEIRIAEAGTAPDAGALVLRFDSNHATDWPQADAGVVKLNWTGPTLLQVDVLRPVRVFALDNHADGVTIGVHFPKGTEEARATPRGCTLPA